MLRTKGAGWKRGPLTSENWSSREGTVQQELLLGENVTSVLEGLQNREGEVQNCTSVCKVLSDLLLESSLDPEKLENKSMWRMSPV